MSSASLARGRASTAKAIRLALRIGAGLVLLWVVGSALVAGLSGAFSEVLARTPKLILLAAVLYALGQLMRIVRLALLIGNARLSLRHLAGLHLYTSGVALGTPLRLGDVYRAVELGRITGGTIVGFTFVWLERLFDAALILPLLLYAVSRNPNPGSSYVGIAFFTLLFLAVSVILVALLPDNLRRVGTYLIRRHEGDWTIRCLRLIDDIRGMMRRIPNILHGKVASLAALTLLVWCFEVSGFAVIMLGWNPGLDPLGGLLAFLSQTVTGGTLPDLLIRGDGFIPAKMAYLAASQVPLAFVSAIAALYLARLWIRRNA
ncbi:MAG: hypothetical protein HOP96_08655 [Sphingomonas sp.]|nr:hypothetical protein [Sphingomonas sp.]